MMPVNSHFDELTSIAKYFFQRHSTELLLQKSVSMERNERTIWHCVPKHERLAVLRVQLRRSSHAAVCTG